MPERTYSFDEEATPDAPDQPKFVYSRSISAAVYLAHRLCVVALILVVLWVIFTNKTEKFLGGLSWQYPHVFNWHPIMMVAGMVVCMTEGLLAFRAFPFDKLINRRVRYIWHTAGIAMMCTGLAAVLMYHNDRNQANLWSLHSWLGVMTISLFLSQYVLGWYIFFNESADTDMREAYIPFFAWLDIFMFVAACFTAEMGIVQKNAQLGCIYNVTEIKDYNVNDPAIYYTDLPSGCRISEGLGIVILCVCLTTVYAALELRLPDVSDTAAGWEAYRLTAEELRNRRTWGEYFASFIPFGKKRKRKRGSSGSSANRTRGTKSKNGWIQKQDAQGVYYYNPKTDESTYDKPPGFD